jgi:hypothetical protein
MRKAILASVLGIAFSGLSAFGQVGQIMFSNYNSTIYNPVVWASDFGLISNKNVDDPNVELQLFYAYGTYTDVHTFLAAATPGVTTFIDPGLNPTGQYGTDSSKGSPGGYYWRQGQQLLPDWVPGETVTFMVEGWDTAEGWGTPSGNTFQTSFITGQTGLWTETGATGNGDGITPVDLPPRYFAAGPPLLVMDWAIPEPATLALGGLGLATLMLFRRHKA